MITIIDYGAGNLRSVEKALEFLGYQAQVTSDLKTIENAQKLILPGVGAFGAAMAKLKSRGLDTLLREVKQKGTPLLGICLGLQLLFDGSEESDCPGLGLLPGEIVKIPDCGLKIPQMGWNSLHIKGGRLLEQLPQQSHVYFVHSYYLKPAEESIVTATTTYGQELSVAVEQGNLFATQFHPEKSGKIGLTILNQFGGII